MNLGKFFLSYQTLCKEGEDYVNYISADLSAQMMSTQNDGQDSDRTYPLMVVQCLLDNQGKQIGGKAKRESKLNRVCL